GGRWGRRTVLSSQRIQHYPPDVLKEANSRWRRRYRHGEIPCMRDNFGVPEVTLRRFLRMPEGAAPDGGGVPGLAVLRVKNGTLARILKFTLGPLERWAL
ncbi:hypothetical protein, partial [Escherichia coli]|uniref:hypothetical protein n=1 Tax=Escherichia coli TaxID=562 RepID=UPI001FCCC14E